MRTKQSLAACTALLFTSGSLFSAVTAPSSVCQLNGTLVKTVDNSLGLDGRRALYPSTDGRGFYLFAGNTGVTETGAGFLGSLAVWAKVLTGAEPGELGSASVVGIPEPSAAVLGGLGLVALVRRRR
jgi:uncharacterized protein (TIGR03382 family)